MRGCKNGARKGKNIRWMCLLHFQTFLLKGPSVEATSGFDLEVLKALELKVVELNDVELDVVAFEGI